MNRENLLTESTCIYSIYVCVCVSVWLCLRLFFLSSLSLSFSLSFLHCQKSIHKTLVSTKRLPVKGTANLWILMTSLNELYGPYFKKKNLYTHTHTHINRVRWKLLLHVSFRMINCLYDKHNRTFPSIWLTFYGVKIAKRAVVAAMICLCTREQTE